MPSFRAIRITLLLLLLIGVAGMTYWERLVVRSWLQPLTVTIYPVNGDDLPETQRHIDALTPQDFVPIAGFLQQQAQRYRLKPLPGIDIKLARQIEASPPMPAAQRSALDAIWWSLKMRHYAYQQTPLWASLGTVRLFVVYHTGEDGKPLQHSLGLQKGLLGVVHVFAQDNQTAQNNIVITHELLHTLGATDKYDANGQPVFPDGFVEPGQGEKYPQHRAEIMAGRIAVRPDRAIIPDSLEVCAVGPKTAYEVNW